MKRTLRTSFAGLLFVTVSLAIAGALYETMGRSRDAERFPQRGHFVQAGAIRSRGQPSTKARSRKAYLRCVLSVFSKTRRGVGCRI